MTEFSHDPVFRVDFNSFDEEGRFLVGTIWHGSTRRFPRVGERVVLHDAEDNRCWAWVRDVKGVLLYFELDESTWVSGEQTLTTAFTGGQVSDWHGTPAGSVKQAKP